MRLAAAICVALIPAAPAFAAPCTSKGSPKAAMISALPDPSNQQFYRGLAAATQPAALRTAGKASCTRAIPGLAGEDTDAYPRVLRDGSRTGYLAPLALGGGKTGFAIVWVWGSGAVRVAGLVDAIPEDVKLAQLLRPDADGGFEPLEFDESAGALVDKNAYLPTQVRQMADKMSACLRGQECP